MYLGPSDNKCFVVRPAIKVAVVYHLKEPSLDPIALDNFYPISNFSLLGQVAEKVIGEQHQGDLEEADYLDPFWLGYRIGTIGCARES